MASSIEFKLFAPNNKGSALIGSFSDWKEIPMEKGEDGYFRTSVVLEDGAYQYKFRVQSKSPSLEPDQVDSNLACPRLYKFYGAVMRLLRMW